LTCRRPERQSNHHTEALHERQSTTALHGIVAEHVAAVNALDEDAIVATFADDALVNDAHREFWGAEAIRRWVRTEMIGDRVTIQVREVVEHHGETIVRGRYDGEYDKTNLPAEVILTNYFTVRDGKIATLIVIRNTPAY
jgi:ketosteroid isomerase-like protein